MNPQWLDQNQLCCQLHHPRSVERSTLTNEPERTHTRQLVVEVHQPAEPDDPPVRAPIAVRLANDLAEVWVAAAGPRHPPVGDPPAPDAMWVGFDEVVVLFDRAEALALGLNDE